MKTKLITIITLFFIFASCNKIDDNHELIKLKNTSDTIKTNISNISNIKNSEIILEYSLNGNYIKGAVKPYPENGTFIPEYKIEMFNKNNKKINLPFYSVRDIRLSQKGDKILYLNTNEELYYYNIKTQKNVLISKESFPTFQFSQKGDKIAYFKGNMPEYDLFIYDIIKKQKLKITPEATPSWSVAFSSNDEDIYFIYSPDGKPALYKYNLEIKKLTEINPELKVFPNSGKPFEIIKNKMIFETDKQIVISSDFQNKKIKTIGNGVFLGVFNEKDILLFKNRIIKYTMGE